MHLDSLEPAAIQFTLEHLQESAGRLGCFLLDMQFQVLVHNSTGTLESDLLSLTLLYLLGFKAQG